MPPSLLPPPSFLPPLRFWRLEGAPAAPLATRDLKIRVYPGRNREPDINQEETRGPRVDLEDEADERKRGNADGCRMNDRAARSARTFEPRRILGTRVGS